MKNRHETRRGIEIKKLDLGDFLADGQELDEALSEMSERARYRYLNSYDEPNWDELAEIAEMEDFAERGLGLF